MAAKTKSFTYKPSKYLSSLSRALIAAERGFRINWLVAGTVANFASCAVRNNNGNRYSKIVQSLVKANADHKNIVGGPEFAGGPSTSNTHVICQAAATTDYNN